MEKVMEFEELKRVRTLMWYMNKPFSMSNLHVLLFRTQCLDTFGTRLWKNCLNNDSIYGLNMTETTNYIRAV